MSQEKKSFADLVKESDTPILVDVFSETCGPCHMLKPVLKELKNKMGDGIRIIKIDGPRNQAFMRDWQIQAFPTMILFNEGKVVWREMGYMPLHQLEKMVRGALPATA